MWQTIYRLLSLLIVIYSTVCLAEQAPTYKVSVDYKESDNLGINTRKFDNDENLYIAGAFHPKLTLGNDTFLSEESNCPGNMFLAKFKANGEYLWSKTSKGKGLEEANDIAFDKEGNVYVTGLISSDYDSKFVYFDNVKINNVRGNQMFVAKYSGDGILQWVSVDSSSIPIRGMDGSVYARRICVSDDGGVFVVGDWSSILVFGKDTVFQSGTGFRSDLFMVKFNDKGAYQWVWTSRGKGEATANDAVLLENHDIVISCGFDNTLYVHSDTLKSAGSTDLAVICLNSKGEEKWARKCGGKNYETANCILTQGANEIILNGCTLGGELEFNDTHITAKEGQSSPFFVKYSPQGDILWANVVNLPSSANINLIRSCTLPGNNIFSTFRCSDLPSGSINHMYSFIVKPEGTYSIDSTLDLDSVDWSNPVCLGDYLYTGSMRAVGYFTGGLFTTQYYNLSIRAFSYKDLFTSVLSTNKQIPGLQPDNKQMANCPMSSGFFINLRGQKVSRGTLPIVGYTASGNYVFTSRTNIGSVQKVINK